MNPEAPNQKSVKDLEDNASTLSTAINYNERKQKAQAMMDMALMTANANQLRYARNAANRTMTGLIGASLLLQIVVVAAFLVRKRVRARRGSNARFVHRVSLLIDDFAIFCIYLITIVNIFITSFTEIDGRPK